MLGSVGKADGALLITCTFRLQIRPSLCGYRLVPSSIHPELVWPSETFADAAEA